MSEKEYIEREAANKVLADDYAYAAAKLLDTVPTADVQEVRHGKWEDEFFDVICSVCKESFNVIDNDVHRFDFCPNCGAKMDKEQE